MTRRNLWQLSCPAKDAILGTSLDARELLAFADAAGANLEFPPGTSRDLPHAAALAVHHACHEPNPFAKKLDALLERLHEEAVRIIESGPLARVLTWIRGDLADLPVPFAGLLWALARDPRDEARTLESWLLWRLQNEGFRALAFGKVELIEIGP